MKTIYRNICLLLLPAAVLLSSCEKTISPTLEKSDPLYVVDAWINNASKPQKIKLMRTQPYFENTTPPGVNGATVTIKDSKGKVYSFIQSSEAGTYVWTPTGAEVFGETGLMYTLTINVGGEVITSTTDMGRVPKVDSITFNKQKQNAFVPEMYFAEFWAFDPVEEGDKYWIRTYKNGQLLSKPADINIAYDAAFKGSKVFSGVQFIQPIRTSINPFDQDSDKKFLSPYKLNDSLYVEITSISEVAFDFLNEVKTQTDRQGGFAELFAAPLANVSSNVRNVNPNGTKVVGFFNVGAVSGLGRKFKSYDEVRREY